MAPRDGSDVKVKKVQPYPFPMQVTKAGAPPFGVQVIKLAQKGAMISSSEVILSVGDEFEVSFEIPVHKVSLRLLAKVVKTYDRVVPQGTGIERLAELYFPTINNEQIRHIHGFIVAIRQVPS